jgi:hypothetical protein
MRRIAPIALPLLLSACFTVHTTEKYEQLLEGWIGQPKVALIHGWGEPEALEEEGDGRQRLTYRRTTTIRTVTYIPTAPGMPRMSHLSTYQTDCETRFLIVDGIVSHWSWEGSCRAP